ncbi:MAG TPA: DeoR/GlpR family DNA-binding transcription regulator [Propionibacteriaceae bacterium]|nr:DeoR/GlpR family DNA-binding transcription regulator [Propionibacteriaceae bacterium]
MEILSSRRRREEIIRLATTSGLAGVTDLSEKFGVSASTIRRDLARLESEGHLARTYGGAIAANTQAELTLRQRVGEAYEEKLAIARWAADQIAPNDTAFLDAGSTVAAVAHQLRARSGLTITTTSLTVLNELARSDHLTVNCLGGTLRPISQGFVGPIAESALDTITFDRAFLGADSVDAQLGICEADPHQTRLKQLAARRARHTYVLAHAKKLGRRPFHAWAQLPHPWTLVTTAQDDAVQAFRTSGVTVVTLPANAT